MRLEKIAAVMFWVMVDNGVYYVSGLPQSRQIAQEPLWKNPSAVVPMFCSKFSVIAQPPKASMYCMGE